MDELEIKRKDKFFSENGNVIYNILYSLMNKDKIVNEEFEVKDLESMNRLRKLLAEMYHDEILRFSNLKSHNTIIKVLNKENLLSKIHLLVSEQFERNYKVTIESQTFPTCISFSSEGNEEVYYLMNWDCATITV